MFPRLQKRGPIEVSCCGAGGSLIRTFPRLQKRGPIEVRRRAALRARWPGFHAYKSVAPLKPFTTRRPAILLWVFPRLQKRGPIEAHPAIWTPNSVSCRFHAYKSVAPLKLRDTGARVGTILAFPRLQKRGPIEA